MQKNLLPAKRQGEAKTTKRFVSGGKDFAARLNQLCNSSLYAPDFGQGRQRWLMRELHKKGVKVSPEAVRKWFHGESHPKIGMARKIADVFDADVGWLVLGHSPEIAPRERRLRDALADGAVNYVAGLIQMNGGHPSFPEEGDVDIVAIIKGKTYSIRVAPGLELEDGGWRFTLPIDYERFTSIGLIQQGPVRYDLIRLTTEGLDEHGVRYGERVELEVEKRASDYVSGGFKWPRITSLSERI